MNEMNETRMSIARSDIIAQFENSPRKVYTYSDVCKVLEQEREFWRLGSTGARDFIEFLITTGHLEQIELKFPSRKEIRYVWGKVSDYELVASLRSKSHFTHYTAVYLHELTEQAPKVLYLNFEQPPKRFRDDTITQEGIDQAFRRPVRVSHYIAEYKNGKICILNGMHTGELGVVEIKGKQDEIIRVTDVERTLIDISVRPVYAGGVFEVLKAYQMAKDKEKVSVNRLAALLHKMNYIYPYHQVIGFYLEKAGNYKESAINLLHKIEMKYDFYLTHNMKEMDYSKKWRLFFPKGF